MATGSWLTLQDLASRMDPQGGIDYIAEMLAQANEVYDDMPHIEANDISGHTFSFRTSIPAGSWRAVNQGVPYGKSTTARSRVGVGSLEGYSQVDRWEAEASGNIEKFRETEDVAFFQGMAQTMASTIFYGNSAANPAQFMGLAPFYNTVNTATAQNATNVIDAGGTGSSNLSFWFLGWGENEIFAVYPRGSQAGMLQENLGTVRAAYDSLGNPFEAYTNYFRHQMGIVPKNWQYGVRIANVDVTNAGLAGSSGYDIFAGFAQAILLLPTGGRTSGIMKVDAADDPSPAVRLVIYTNRTGRHWMDVQAMRDRNVLLSIKDYAGNPTTGWRDVPVKVVDQLSIAEARVV